MASADCNALALMFHRSLFGLIESYSSWLLREREINDSASASEAREAPYLIDESVEVRRQNPA